MNKIRLGLIGCGGIAQHAHLPSIQRVLSYQLTALSDPYLEVAQKVATAYGLDSAQAYDTHHPILERSDIDAVVICAPTTLHAEISIAALRAGKHVLVEKPMAVTSDEAHAMIAASKETGKTLMVAYNHTYDLATMRLREMLQQGELGEILYAEAFFYEDLYAWTAGALNRTIRAENQKSFWPKYDNAYEDLREFLHNFASHVTNVFRILLGEPREVSFARGNSDKSFIAVLDYGSFPLYLKNVRIKQGNFEKGVEISGTKKRVRLDLAPPLQRYTPGKLTITDIEKRATTIPDMDWAWPFQLEHQHFADALLNKTTPLTHGEQAIGDVQLAEQLSRKALA